MRVPHHLADSAVRLTDARAARAFWDNNRDTLLVTDARAIGGVEGCKPGFRVSDSPINRQAVHDAYADYIFDLENAWRTPPRDAFGSYPYTAAAVGASCTVDGRPGRLVRENGVLICKPVEEVSKVSSFRPVGADAAKPPRDPDEDEDDENGDDEDDGETTADARIASVDTISANHQQRMQQLYDAHARELSEAWKGDK